MKYAIIVWEKDPAGMNIKDKLVKSGRFVSSDEDFDGYPVLLFGDSVKLYTILKQHVINEELGSRIDADRFIFATTHKSVKEVHSLSVHAIGNWGEAQLGGKSETIVPVDPAIVFKLFKTLSEEGAEIEGYEITLEATHHGPYLDKPTCFIEIGSTEEQWKDDSAGKVIANTLLRSFDEGFPKLSEAGFGIGGTHYCARFNRRFLEEQFYLTQICPKYALEFFDQKILDQCLSKSTVPIKYAVCDWKGMGKEKTRVVDSLEANNIEIRKI